MHPEVTSLEQQEAAQAPVTTPEGGEESHSVTDTKHRSQATRLIELVTPDLELFHTEEQLSYATFTMKEHQETWALKSKMFRHWLARQCYVKHGFIPNAQAVQAVLGGLEGKALFQGHEQGVFTRLAQCRGCIYLDLANENWEVVEITQDGWRLVTDPPVKFRRPSGMLPLPTPRPGGSLATLRSFLNVGTEQNWILTLAWLLAALRPHGPYPVLIVQGEQGSAKSSLVRILRSLVDPNKSPLRADPRDVHDVMIAANNSWMLAFDNLSRIPPWLSDSICRLSTGGGLSTRELYTDSEEVLFNAQRPVVVNGIEELAARPDLLDRSIIEYLPEIPPDKRRTEEALWAEFETVRPSILGALLTVCSGALKYCNTVQLAKPPRMADFAVWAVAADKAMQREGRTFMQAYTGNREDANDLALEGSPIVPPLRAVLAQQSSWTGTASELLSALTEHVEEHTRRQRDWPDEARKVSNQLRRLVPNLKATGIQVTFEKETTKARRRLIILERVGNGSSESSAASDTQSEPVAQADAADAPPAHAPPLRPAATQRDMEQSDDTDAADATIPSYSDTRAEPMEVDLRAD